MKQVGAGIAGAVLVVASHAALRRVLLLRAQSAMNQVHDGHVGAALSMYTDSATLRLGEGRHRWAGEHHGREAIRRFLRAFADAGLVGQFHEVWLSGPPWAMRVVMQFEEQLTDESHRIVYRNDLAMMIRMRWGRIIDHTDLVFSTGRIEELEHQLESRRSESSPAARHCHSLREDEAQA